jgi:hypothetical protein
MSLSPRYLTKSRFKLAVECPRKLFYANKPEEYLDVSTEDSLLAALAEGGYQVGELARLEYPCGHSIDTLEHAAALDQTAELLKRDSVIIYEAALAAGELFIRVDVLVKNGDHVDLIEVKAKSYSKTKDGLLCNKNGTAKSDFLPYIRDVAFQRFVAKKARPDLTFRAFLMLADKEKQASVSGLNQNFRVTKSGSRLITKTVSTDRAVLGNSLLSAIDVDNLVDQVLSGSLYVAPGKQVAFDEAVQQFSASYAKDAALPSIPTAKCSSCQFKAATWPASGEKKSGFHQCWSDSFKLTIDDFRRGTVLDIWSFTKKNALIERNVVKLVDVVPEDIGDVANPPGVDGMTRAHRQWYSCAPGSWPGGGPYYFNKEGFRRERAKWKFPLHFIDFETSLVAIPFVSGRCPYEIIAFQFSHHRMEADGSFVHKTQWLCVDPGVDPNVTFVEELKKALDTDDGTIFRWAAHENTVLNHLRKQILRGHPINEKELVAFIESITERRGEGENHAGSRNMVDLCAIAEHFYFHPTTRGSSSLKKVLPALMESSATLRRIYEQPFYGGEGVSQNLKQKIAWYQIENGKVKDPYKLLPPIFGGLDVDAVAEQLPEDIRDGGAALSAYSRLQFEDIGDAERAAIIDALYRYCELDTLAMVMAYQAWQAEANGG